MWNDTHSSIHARPLCPLIPKDPCPLPGSCPHFWHFTLSLSFWGAHIGSRGPFFLGVHLLGKAHMLLRPCRSANPFTAPLYLTDSIGAKVEILFPCNFEGSVSSASNLGLAAGKRGACPVSTHLAYFSPWLRSRGDLPLTPCVQKCHSDHQQGSLLALSAGFVRGSFHQKPQFPL